MITMYHEEPLPIVASAPQEREHFRFLFSADYPVVMASCTIIPLSARQAL